VSQRPILVVQHEEICPPGWMGEWLLEAGADVDVRRPYRGEALPEVLHEHAGMLVLGGSMDAYAEAAHPWLGRVKALVRHAAAAGTPTLGICLGHQLAAAALGGAVHRNPLGQQLGVLEVGWTDAAGHDPLLGSLAVPARAVQWNNDVVAVLPPDSEVLARAASGELQAARFAPTVWGVQWHPEVDEETVSTWTEHDRDSVHDRGVDLDAHLRGIAAAREELRAAWRPLAESFVALSRSEARTP
jgi:GMP synthase (glutamine-hydrolysing)